MQITKEAGINKETFSPELVLKVVIPLERVQDGKSVGDLTEQERIVIALLETLK